MAPAPGEAAHPALALANSRPRGREDLPTAAALRAWLVAHGLPAGGALDLDAFHALREAVRELLLARIDGRRPARSAIEAVNAASAVAPTVLLWSEPDAPRVVREGAGAALARALLAADAIGLVTAAEHANLRACSAPGCVRLLLKDHSRRHWCSTGCGDRVRASRYYHRRKGTRA